MIYRQIVVKIPKPWTRCVPLVSHILEENCALLVIHQCSTGTKLESHKSTRKLLAENLMKSDLHYPTVARIWFVLLRVAHITAKQKNGALYEGNDEQLDIHLTNMWNYTIQWIADYNMLHQLNSKAKVTGILCTFDQSLDHLITYRL